MSTTIRPELSEKNKYWISRHRFYELKHFCLQYQDWKNSRGRISVKLSIPVERKIFSEGEVDDPTARLAEECLFYTKRIEMVEKCAKECDPVIGIFVLEGVTTGTSFEALKARKDIPCQKDTYYDRYRKFFWLLDKVRE